VGGGGGGGGAWSADDGDRGKAAADARAHADRQHHPVDTTVVDTD